MKHQSHPAAPHILADNDGHFYVDSSPALTQTIAQAAKAALGTWERGAWSQQTQVKVQPPDSDTDQYTLSFEIPATANNLSQLSMIRSGVGHTNDHLAPLHLQITYDDAFYHCGWLAYTINPTAAAIARARLDSAQADYLELGQAARTNSDGGGAAADEFANTDEPLPQNYALDHAERCEALLASARRLAAWSDETQPASFMSLLQETGETIPYPISQQADAHAILARQVAEAAAQLSYIA